MTDHAPECSPGAPCICGVNDMICAECKKRRGKHRAPNPRNPSIDWQCPSDDPEKRWDDPPKTFFREEESK